MAVAIIELSRLHGAFASATTGLLGLNAANHDGYKIASENILPSKIHGNFKLNDAVIDALPVPGSRVISAAQYGMSSETAQIDAELPDGRYISYLLKTASIVTLGRSRIEGEFESLKAINSISPGFVPFPYSWGVYEDEAEEEVAFLLTEFREVGQQPPDHPEFTARLADLHKRSISPTGKFGFHVTTFQGPVRQETDCWEDSWEVLYKKQMARLVGLSQDIYGRCPKFDILCRLTLGKVIPRLLRPLQTDGRSIKPCLVHGNLRDENTATDAESNRPFLLSPGAFYAHNEYELGAWRSIRGRLSNKIYAKSYRKYFAISEPEDDWDDRNLLYSIAFDLSRSILKPDPNMRQIVKNGMEALCKKFCPQELYSEKVAMSTPASLVRVAEGLPDIIEPLKEEREEDTLRLTSESTVEDDDTEDEDEDEDIQTKQIDWAKQILIRVQNQVGFISIPCGPREAVSRVCQRFLHGPLWFLVLLYLQSRGFD